MKATVIITTYNRSEALRLVLASYLQQRNIAPDCWEIIVADDGSTAETAKLVSEFQARSPIPITHIWQEDAGFQAAKIRNKAVAAARGAYLIFTDGDCMAPPHFVVRHLSLARRGYLVPGNRILISKEYTAEIEANHDIGLSQKSPWALRVDYQKGHVNRVHAAWYLPFYPRYLQPQRWRGAKTCNLGVWREDFIAVNGFDETFQGWGFEDSDLVVRLFHHGIKRKDGRFASYVFHLWHAENDRSQHDQNWQRFQKRIHQNITEATLGIQQYKMLD